MEAFIRVAPWNTFVEPDSQRPSSSASSARRPFGHFRSLSAVPAKSTNPRPARSGHGHGRSPSTSQLPEFSFPLSGPPSHSARPTSPFRLHDDDDLSTLPDPRMRTLSHSVNGDGVSVDGDRLQEPQDEVTALSTKLIRAINHQTTLDNALSSARQGLDRARERIRQLESQAESQREMLAGDVWVRRQAVESEKRALIHKAAEERRLREAAEREKRRIEHELENLTTALFEEANKMVVTVKEEALLKQEAAERKNEQLRAQVADTESLLQSQQQQLAGLKVVMEQMTADQDEHANLTAPSSPGGGCRFDAAAAAQERRISSEGGLHPLALPLAGPPVSPSHPTSFSHLIQPVLRTDLAAYEDFKALARASKHRAGSRASSSSLNGINVMSLGLGGGSSSSPAAANTHSSTPSTSSLPTGLASPSATSSPQGPATAAAAMPTTPAGPLKDTKFFKRAVVEDIEPTLRLDTAPGLSWLARRSVLSAIAEGTLVVEPAPSQPAGPPPAPHPRLHPCALCGEAGRDEAHLRTHRFRTTESESAQRYPLCGYCLARVRSTCDFLGFLRIVKDGQWRVAGEEEAEEGERRGWEESVRLREQMFWARIGGGVVPAGTAREVEDKGAAGGPGVVDTKEDDKEVDTKEDDGEVEVEVEGGTGGGEVDGDDHDDARDASPSPSPRVERSPQITVQSPPEGPAAFVPHFGSVIMGV